MRPVMDGFGAGSAAGSAQRLRWSGMRPDACRDVIVGVWAGIGRSILGGIAVCLLGALGLTSNVQAQTVTYTYDSGTNGIGRLTGVSDPSGSVAVSYDIMGRIMQRVQVVNSTPYPIQTTYDPDRKSVV